MAGLSLSAGVINIIIASPRKCGICGAHDHIRSNRAFHPQEVAAAAEKSAQKASPPLPVFWHPDLFTSGGVVPLPPLVAWQKGTDSLAFAAQMRQMNMYRYDADNAVWRRT